MATSPNYSWPEPDNTDLVKNGALAMRTLGNAIDTTMATMTPKSTFTAKGSLIAATAASTPANLAVGNNGETLVADSSTATGLRYQVPVNVNPVLNSAFQVWQRGTSFTTTDPLFYSADRYWGYSPTTGRTYSRQTTSDTTNLPFIQYCARIARNSGNANTSALYFGQSMETINSIPFAGKTVTFSFYARAGANYSASSGSLNSKLVSGTGTDQNLISGYTGSADVINQNATLTTTWQRFTYTGTVATTATELSFQWLFTPTGTAGAADYYEITGVQLEVGSVATPFKTYAGTIQGELAACQRYFSRWEAAANSFLPLAAGFSETTSTIKAIYRNPVIMRSAPTVTISGSYQDNGGNGVTVTAPLAIQEFIEFTATATGTPFVAWQGRGIRANNDLTAKIFISAEL